MRINGSALASIVAVTLRMNLRRLTLWVFAGVFLWVVYLLYWGSLGFGGMTASGAKLATNSEFAIATTLGFFSFLLMHFTATLTGDPVVVDARLGTSPLLRAMPIDRGTYLLGKFLGGYFSLLSIYVVFLAALILGQFLPPAEDKLTLPVQLVPYLEFAFLFMLVPTFFVGAVSFAIGSLSGSMKLVYITVTVLFVSWWLILNLVPDEHYRWMAWLEPSGTLWLAEHVAKSRGNAWLNTHPIVPDLPFLLNRLAMLGFGAACLGLTLAVFRGADLAQEYGGEVKDGWLARITRWARGRHRELEDRYTNWSGSGAIPRVEPAPRGVLLWCRHLLCSTVTELRLLAAERSLWIMVPVIVVVAVFTTGSAAGPFRVPIYPVSSEFAARMVGTLLILIAGTCIFYTGEVFHRDDANGVRSIIYATPVANSVMIAAKLLATVALSCIMVLLTYATAVVTQLVLWWRLEQRVYFDPGPYVELGLRLMLPAVVIICCISLAVNVLVRGRYLAYFTLIILGASYLWAIFDGQRSLLVNPLLLGHLRYSDMTRLEPFELTLELHHAYWGSLVACLLFLAIWFFSRSALPQWNLRQYVAASYVRRRTGLLAFLIVSAAGVVWSAGRIRAEGSVQGTEAEREAAQLRMEDSYLAELWAPMASYAAIDIEVELWPERSAVDVRGRLTLVNDHPEPLDRLRFTVDPLYTIRRFEISSAAGPFELNDAILTVPLDPPLAPAQSLALDLDWSGQVNPGIARDGGPQGTFIHDSATFISSFRPEIVPIPGISAELFMADPETREEHGRGELELLSDLSKSPWVPSLFGGSRPFQLRARISVPSTQVALSSGELVERLPSGRAGDPRGRTAYVYETRHPVRSFSILSAAYEMRRSGDDEVWYHAEHTYNLDTVLEALEDGRSFFERSFGPYPHRLLRIAEFPRVASFAQTYPTLMPYSESIGFLTNYRDNDRFLDATYFVTAHEVAHQWWGYVVSPGASLGAQVLSESLAEYSAIVLLEEERGERSSLICLRREEAAYVRRRDPDREKPLAEVALEGAPVFYNKGGLVFHLLEQQIGRERVLAGLADLIATFRHRPDDPALADPDATRRLAALTHPTIEDLIESLRAQHRGEDLDWFYDTWFRQVSIPDMALLGTPELVREADGWSVHFEATNLSPEIGGPEGPPTPPLPVEIELVSGNWKAEDRGSMQPGEWEVSPPMRLWLTPGESTRGTLSSSFKPTWIVIDRSFACIDFDRTNNAQELSVPEESGASGAVQGTPAAR